jgi:hypothetical protein
MAKLRWPSRTRSFWSLLLAAALVALATLFALSSSARPAVDRKAGAPKPTILLVHGAWADASGWNDVTGRLQRDGTQRG